LLKPNQKVAFSLMNRSRNGELTKNEMIVIISGIFKVLKELTIPGFNSKVGVEFATEVFHLLDTDKDGIVNFPEFCEGLQKNSSYIKCLGVLKNDSTTRTNTNAGQLVTIGGKSWVSAFEMMLGMRLALEYVSDLGRPSKKGDFTVKLTFSLPEIIGSASEFVDYAPHAFDQIRKIFGIPKDEYIISLGPEQILGNLLIGNMSSLSEKVSDGKSGSFFFYSHDSRFMVKTIPNKELNIFTQVLPEYYKHISMNPETLMVRMYASHEIDNTAFVVMGNCFESPYNIDLIYDLKGSTVGRTNPNGFVKKDLDLLESKQVFKIGKEQKEKSKMF
jgi:1-phosphatidylinositol-4-phosphate 5-kinase